jgi:hypothetical protein
VLTAITNEDRALNNASSLNTNELLQKAAQLKANDMATRGYFSHNSPDGLTPWYWLDKVGYKYKYAGENLAVDFFESRDVAQAWMNSPTHRANVVNKKYTEIGIAIAEGVFEGKNTVFVVQFFGTPKVQTPQTPIKTQDTNVVSNEKVATESNAIKTDKQDTLDAKVLGEQSADFISREELVEKPSIEESSKAEIFLGKLLTSPRSTVAYVYQGIALLFVLALLIFLIKTEKKHPSVIIKGSAMVALIFVLMVLNIKVYDNQASVPLEATATNAIYTE